MKMGSYRWRIYSHNVKDNMGDLVYYEELAKKFNIKTSDLVRIPQGHSSNIRIVTRDVAGEGVIREEIDGYFDGAITNEKGIMLLTIQSDCTPVFILDKKNEAIAMIHSGWRGTVQNITNKAISLMEEKYGTKKSDLLIYFGPSICGNCYEVGEELIDEFKKILNNDGLKSVFVKIDDKKDKYYLDVTEAIRLTLINNSILDTQISRSKFCTFHSNIFNSWRRDRVKEKQMLTGIILRKQ